MCAKRATRSICRSLPNSGVEIALPDGLPRGGADVVQQCYLRRAALDRAVSVVHIAFGGRLLAPRHGNGYDFAKTITLNGTMRSFEWSNPRCLLDQDVPDEGGKLQRWTMEMSSPTILSRHGWTKDSFKAGDPNRLQPKAEPAFLR
jgi:hypothetical protein